MFVLYPKELAQEQEEILPVLAGKRDTVTCTKNPKKDLQDLADWERITQLRKDAPLREFPPHPDRIIAKISSDCVCGAGNMTMRASKARAGASTKLFSKLTFLLN